MEKEFILEDMRHADAGEPRIILKFIILDFLYIVGDWILYVIGLVYNFRLL